MASGNEGINKLARTLQRRMKEIDVKPPMLDFAVIQKDMSLLTNKFPLPIPQPDYIICNSVNCDSTLQSGDRVLVAWVGDDPVVIDIIMAAEVI